MASCVKTSDKFLLSLRLLRNLQLRNERFLSTTTCHHAKFIPPSKPLIIDKEKGVIVDRTFLSPEFIPPRQRTDPLKFFLERKDMVRRRKVVDIPEFYVGSILAVTMADPNAGRKSHRFVGICIQRGGKGLGATFILRNIIDGQGVEICYEIYNPCIQNIEVLKLEKRLDDNLMYLRDALPKFSTVDPDTKASPLSPTEEVPVNRMKVKMCPKPWSKRWERPKYNIKGVSFELVLTPKKMEHAQKWAQPWLEYDMLKEYDTSALEKKIYSEVQQELEK